MNTPSLEIGNWQTPLATIALRMNRRRFITLRPQRSKAHAKVLGQEIRLLPRREVGAHVVLAVVDHLGIGTLCPGARGGIDLLGEDSHDHGNCDALDIEES